MPFSLGPPSPSPFSSSLSPSKLAAGDRRPSPISSRLFAGQINPVASPAPPPISALRLGSISVAAFLRILTRSPPLQLRLPPLPSDSIRLRRRFPLPPHAFATPPTLPRLLHLRPLLDLSVLLRYGTSIDAQIVARLTSTHRQACHPHPFPLSPPSPMLWPKPPSPSICHGHRLLTSLSSCTPLPPTSLETVTPDTSLPHLHPLLPRHRDLHLLCVAAHAQTP